LESLQMKKKTFYFLSTKIL